MFKLGVLTGGPSNGKTTTCRDIRDILKYETFAEVAQQVISEGRFHPLTDRTAFQNEVFRRQLALEGEIVDFGRIGILDRGIFDGEAYYRMDGLAVPSEFNAIDPSRYGFACVLEPLDTFVHDGVRFEDLDFSAKITPLLYEAYAERGIPTFMVPKMSRSDRVHFILDKVNELLTQRLQAFTGLQTVEAQDWLSCLSQAHRKRIHTVITDLTAGFGLLSNVGESITYYGSVRIQPGSDDYKFAEELSYSLASLGFAGITGGGPGLSEAANKGTARANQPSIGLNIRLAWEQQINPYCTQSIECANFATRKMLMERSCAYVVFKGGLGTMDELSELIDLIQTGKIRKCPVILIGRKFWRGYVMQIRTMIKEGLCNEMIPIVCDTADEAKRALVSWYDKNGLTLPTVLPMAA